MSRDELLALRAGALREDEELQGLTLILRPVVAELGPLEERLVAVEGALRVAAAGERDDLFDGADQDFLAHGARGYFARGPTASSC